MFCFLRDNQKNACAAHRLSLLYLELLNALTGKKKKKHEMQYPGPVCFTFLLEAAILLLPLLPAILPVVC